EQSAEVCITYDSAGVVVLVSVDPAISVRALDTHGDRSGMSATALPSGQNGRDCAGHGPRGVFGDLPCDSDDTPVPTSVVVDSAPADRLDGTRIPALAPTCLSRV